MIRDQKKKKEQGGSIPILLSRPLLDAASPGGQQGRGQPLTDPRVPGLGTKQRPAGCVCPVLSDSLGGEMVNVA